MITRILAIASLLLFGLFASAAQGATAISYSEEDNTYGWCAGYSTSEAPGCAKRLCEESNGQNCKLALVCDAGWNAVAFADSDEAVGFGASCDMGSAYNARLSALASCIAQSGTLCWTNSTFNGGGDERSPTDNGEFDLTWYVQGLLKGLNYDPGSTDGEFGNRTRSAIRAFQADMGLEQTGEATEELVYILLGKNGGVTYLVAAMGQLVGDFTTDEKSRVFSASYAPLQNPTLSDELSFRTTAVQRVLLADYLQFNKYDCPVPATRAERTDPENGVWTVTCSGGGDYTIALSVDGTSDTIADNNAAQPEPEPEPQTEVSQNDPSPAAPAASTTGIAFSHSPPEDSWYACTGAVSGAAECAQTACADEFKGTECATVLTCDNRGWSAAAMSPNQFRGMGFACGYTTAYGAREAALMECLHKVRAICELVFSAGPDTPVATDEENTAFTLIFHVQAMTAQLGYYQEVLTGEDSQATLDAVKRLQTELGLEANGVIDDDLYWKAYYGNLGRARYVATMERDIYNTMSPDNAPYHYGNSALPSAEVFFADEIAALPEEERLVAVASAISVVDGAYCTMPALDAVRDGADWIADCAEGKVRLTFQGYDMSITNVAATTPPAVEPTPADPEPPTIAPGKDKGKGPATPATPAAPPSGKSKG